VLRSMTLMTGKVVMWQNQIAHAQALVTRNT
jgi:hypothetical protein